MLCQLFTQTDFFTELRSFCQAADNYFAKDWKQVVTLIYYVLRHSVNTQQQFCGFARTLLKAKNKGAYDTFVEIAHEVWGFLITDKWHAL